MKTNRRISNRQLNEIVANVVEKMIMANNEDEAFAAAEEKLQVAHDALRDLQGIMAKLEGSSSFAGYMMNEVGRIDSSVCALRDKMSKAQFGGGNRYAKNNWR